MGTLLLGGGLACSSDPPTTNPEQSNKMVDPDGTYEFGMWDEEWVLAADLPPGNFGGDEWTNSLSEQLSVETSLNLVQGETAESQTVRDNDIFNFGTEKTLRFPPEATPDAPGWWWWGVNNTATSVSLRANFVATPRGLRVELRQLTVNGDRAVALLASLKLR